jgi:hypothetical protein
VSTEAETLVVFSESAFPSSDSATLRDRGQGR